MAVAEVVYVLCGPHKIHWDIFRIAYEGRSRLLFQLLRTPSGTEIQSYIPFVREARLRYRNYENPKCLDLGIVLTSFSYSKEENPRDHIFAALGIVRPQPLCRDIVPDYTKSVKDVFYEASCHIIRLRKDLYLWSGKTLITRRTMCGLPSWVPEWTMKTCEEAMEFASPKFSRCVLGNLAIQGESLFVDGHLLDEVDATFIVKDDREVPELVVMLDRWLRQHGSDLFGAYSGADPELINVEVTAAGDLPWQESGIEASQLLSEFDDIPPVVAGVIRGTNGETSHPLDNSLFNIEAMWSTLTAVFNKRVNKPEPSGYRLFLAMLYMLSKLARSQGAVRGRLPKAFNLWIIAAAILHSAGTNTKIFTETYKRHFERCDTFGNTGDCFFVTKNGFFGRAPAEAVKHGQVVAVLRGAYVPYLLEKRENHYQLISHAYVDGIMCIEKMPAAWKVQKIEIR